MIGLIIIAVSAVSLTGLGLWSGRDAIVDRILDWKMRVRKNAACPACRARNGEIVYNPEIQKIVHGCNECNAAWPENPVIPPQAWDFLGRDLKQAGADADSVREAFAIANSPIKLKDQPKEQVN